MLCSWIPPLGMVAMVERVTKSCSLESFLMMCAKLDICQDHHSCNMAVKEVSNKSNGIP
jgi:hypothetical protein